MTLKLKKQPITRIFLFLIGVCAAIVPCRGTEAVSIATLLREMINRDAIARFPEPAFTCKQFSSYDRASVAKGQLGWFANNDSSNFLRVEKHDGRREFVMMDAEGPGAVVRFWMTCTGEEGGQGTLRFYVDDNPTPAIEGAVFDILSGGKIVSAPLSASVSELTPLERRGHNLYFPIPYAKRCKITYESDSLGDSAISAPKSTAEVYYNINYRTYDREVNVVSYSPEEMQKNESLIADVQAKLAVNARMPAPVVEQVALDASLQPGKSRKFDLQGPAAIQRLSLQLQAENKEQALRSTVIEIAFDGENAVWSPVGDFFGIGYKQLYTNTWYTSASETGLMEVFWVMPFARKCAITLHNMGEQPVRIVNASAETKAWNWDAHSMHFGAQWRQYTRVTGGANECSVDLNFATLKGRGVYVGDSLALFNTVNRWWGEGDEKIYVDGETFPSHFGTGTEDYYGYAWCLPAVFTGHPFIAQPYGNGATSCDYVVNTRFRALDGIPFTKSLVFDMELWRAICTRMNYAPVAFWYVTPGGKNTMPRDIEGVKEPVVLDRTQIYSPELTLSVEGENLLLDNKSKGENYRNYLTSATVPWSDGAQLIWRKVSKGDKATFSFNSKYEGSFELTGLFTTAPGYGVFDIYFNEEKIWSNLDLANRETIIKKISAGTVRLRKGSNKLMVEMVKEPQNSKKTATFGLDKLIFE